MSLIQQIKDDRITAMKAGDKTKSTWLVTLLSEVQRSQSSPSEVPSDEEVQKVVKKCIKGLDDLIANSGGTPEMHAEKDLLQGYMPTLMGEDELTKLVEQEIAENRRFDCDQARKQQRGPKRAM